MHIVGSGDAETAVDAASGVMVIRGQWLISASICDKLTVHFGVVIRVVASTLSAARNSMCVGVNGAPTDSSVAINALVPTAQDAGFDVVVCCDAVVRVVIRIDHELACTFQQLMAIM